MVIIFYKTPSGREPAREYIDNLEKCDHEIVRHDIELLRKLGFSGVPVATRHLKGKLWEIKTGTGHQQRIFYCVVTGPVMVLLHACKKQKQGCQHEDVAVAYYRMREVLGE